MKEVDIMYSNSEKATLHAPAQMKSEKKYSEEFVYECSGYCRACPFPGLKCAEDKRSKADR